MRMVLRLVEAVGSSSSLLRCKSRLVSRRWLSAISKNEAVFVVAGRNDYRIIEKSGTIKPYVLPWSTKQSNLDQKIVLDGNVSNSCNGMMLFSSNESIFLFNPETQYFQKVLQLDCYNSGQRHWTTLGLCYDPSIDDYKALVHFRLYSKCRGFVAMAKLKEKRWIKREFPFDMYGPVEKGPEFRGRLHWIVEIDNTCGNLIARYDATTNAFSILPSPPIEGESGENKIMGLGVMDDCLWMTRWRYNGTQTGEVEVFKMREYGVPASWTLMYVITCVRLNKDDTGMTPLLTMENGRILFSKKWNENSNAGELLAYDPDGNWCHTHCTTPRWNPLSIPFVKKKSASPVGYNWDPIRHQHFGYFDELDYSCY